jgi:hypothetical protein
MWRGNLTTLVIIIALVYAHMLRRFRCGLGPLHHDRIQGGSQQLHVVPIGPCHDDRDGNALPSVSPRHFVPHLPRSVGLRPVPFPHSGSGIAADTELRPEDPRGA